MGRSSGKQFDLGQSNQEKEPRLRLKPASPIIAALYARARGAASIGVSRPTRSSRLAGGAAAGRRRRFLFFLRIAVRG